MSVWLSLDLCGFGVTGGLFPELRLGILRIGCCRGAIAERARDARSRMERTLTALGLGARP